MARAIKTARTGGGTSVPGPGNQGTLGGVKQHAGSRPGRRQVTYGDEVYLWALVFAEVAAIAWLRSAFSRYHGG